MNINSKMKYTVINKMDLTESQVLFLPYKVYMRLILRH